jgi:hypothetical protein
MPINPAYERHFFQGRSQSSFRDIYYSILKKFKVEYTDIQDLVAELRKIKPVTRALKL